MRHDILSVDPTTLAIDVRYTFDDGTTHDCTLAQVAGPDLLEDVDVPESDGGVTKGTRVTGTVVKHLASLPPDELDGHLRRYGEAYWRGVGEERANTPAVHPSLTEFVPAPAVGDTTLPSLASQPPQTVLPG